MERWELVGCRLPFYQTEKIIQYLKFISSLLLAAKAPQLEFCCIHTLVAKLAFEASPFSCLLSAPFAVFGDELHQRQHKLTSLAEDQTFFPFGAPFKLTFFWENIVFFEIVLEIIKVWGFLKNEIAVKDILIHKFRVFSWKYSFFYCKID